MCSTAHWDLVFFYFYLFYFARATPIFIIIIIVVVIRFWLILCLGCWLLPGILATALRLNQMTEERLEVDITCLSVCLSELCLWFWRVVPENRT